MSWSLTGVKGLTDKISKGWKEGQYFQFFFSLGFSGNLSRRQQLFIKQP